MAAGYALYRARGGQISCYGYAAFGLTVIPYLIMSLLNSFADAVTPSYPTCYLVRSEEMDEAERREGCYFDGVVGRLVRQETNGDEAESDWRVVSIHHHDPHTSYKLERLSDDGTTDSTLPTQIEVYEPGSTTHQFSMASDELKKDGQCSCHHATK